jgi:hydroxypyruvate isomerase
VSTGDLFVYPNEGTVQMIVIGADTHKVSHTLAAVQETTGRTIAEQTVKAKRRSFDDLLRWARGLGEERVWAIEDRRHVSGALERFLLKAVADRVAQAGASAAGRAGTAKDASGGMGQARRRAGPGLRRDQSAARARHAR